MPDEIGADKSRAAGDENFHRDGFRVCDELSRQNGVHLVRAGFRHQIVGAQQGFKCAGIGPPAVQDFVGELAFLDVEIIHVGDFQFAASGRFQAANLLEDGRVVEINSDHGIIRFRRSWAFLRCRPRDRREFPRRRTAARL